MNRCDKHIESLVDECDDDDETDCSHDYRGSCAFVELRSGQDDKKDPDFQEKLVDNLKSAVTTVAKDKKYPPKAVPRMFIIIGQQLLTHSGKIARTFLRRIITLTKDISKVCALKNYSRT